MIMLKGKKQKPVKKLGVSSNHLSSPSDWFLVKQEISMLWVVHVKQQKVQSTIQYNNKQTHTQTK